MTFTSSEKDQEAQRIADNMQKFAKKQFDTMYSKIKELEEQNQVRLDAINARDTQINYLQQINDEYEKKVKLLEKDVEYCWVIPNKNQIEKEATERINYLNKKSGWRGFIEGALWIQSVLKIKPADSKDAVILQKEQQIQSLQEEIEKIKESTKLDIEDLQGENAALRKDNSEMAETVISLREEMKKKDAAIHLAIKQIAENNIIINQYLNQKQ